MNDTRYKQLMSDAGMPDSKSLLMALKQVANEVSQDLEARLEGEKWIDVNDRLPAEGVEVLIINSEGMEVAKLAAEVMDTPDSMGGDAGFYGPTASPARSTGDKEYRYDARFQPTHWQPLPDGPLID